MYYNGPIDNEQNKPKPQPKPKKPRKYYPTDTMLKAAAIRERITRELRAFGRAPTEDEANMILLCNEILDGEE